MRRVISTIIFTLILLSGIFLTAYPYLYNSYVEKHQSRVIDSYNSAIDNIDKEKLREIKAEVEEYNKGLISESIVLTDPFDEATIKKNKNSQEFADLLDIGGNGVISTVNIPKIDVSLPVYHGTDERTLSSGAGHLQGTSFPIGGENTHSIITGHTGLSNKRLFTDLTELVLGDVFYLKTIGQTLSYEVDSINIVDPSDTSLLNVEDGKDYVTLLTCYPYGINSHRLLVRGYRIPYEKAVEKQKESENEHTTSQWLREYIKAIVIGSIIFAIVILAMIISNRTNKVPRGFSMPSLQLISLDFDEDDSLIECLAGIGNMDIRDSFNKKGNKALKAEKALKTSKPLKANKALNTTNELKAGEYSIKMSSADVAKNKAFISLPKWQKNNKQKNNIEDKDVQNINIQDKNIRSNSILNKVDKLALNSSLFKKQSNINTANINIKEENSLGKGIVATKGENKRRTLYQRNLKNKKRLKY